MTVCPSTSVAVAGDLDPRHDPAETNEPPMIAVHAYLETTVISHAIAVGSAGSRSPIAPSAPAFVDWARDEWTRRTSPFNLTTNS